MSNLNFKATEKRKKKIQFFFIFNLKFKSKKKKIGLCIFCQKSTLQSCFGDLKSKYTVQCVSTTGKIGVDNKKIRKVDM